MSNRLRVIKFLNDIVNRQEESETLIFQTQPTFSVLPIDLTQATGKSVTIQGKGAVSYQLQNPIALVPVVSSGLTAQIAYQDFPNNPDAKSVAATSKTISTQIFTPGYWTHYLADLSSSLSANFQTVEVGPGTILRDPNGRPVLLPSFVFVDIVKGASFFKSAETAAATGTIRQGGDVYTVTLFPANFAQLSRAVFSDIWAKEGGNAVPLSPLSVFEQALRSATAAIGTVAKAGASDVDKRNFAGALMPGTDTSLEVARAVALAKFAQVLRDNVKNLKVVQFQLAPDAQGRLSADDWKQLMSKLGEVYGWTLGVLGSTISSFCTWGTESIKAAQMEALKALSGSAEATDIWATARVSQPAQITFNPSTWTVTAQTATLRDATANAKFAPLPTIVPGSSLIRAKEGGGSAFTRVAEVLTDAMNAIGHNWDLVTNAAHTGVLDVFNQKWGIWTGSMPSLFSGGKLRPLHEVMAEIGRALAAKRASLSGPLQETFDNEATIIMNYINTLYGPNPTLISLQNIDMDIQTLASQTGYQWDPITKSALGTLQDMLPSVTPYIPTLETQPSYPTTPWELPKPENQQPGTGTTGLELTPQ